MYSRNTKNTADRYDYPFTLPERYGGSRFRTVKEPETHVHTETSVPQTPSPIHLSPAVADITQGAQVESVFDTISAVMPEEEAEPGEANFADRGSAERENTASAENQIDEAPVATGASSSPLPSSGLDAEDLLLIGLILLLSRDGTDSAELPALLALLLAYRPSPSENK